MFNLFSYLFSPKNISQSFPFQSNQKEYTTIKYSGPTNNCVSSFSGRDLEERIKWLEEKVKELEEKIEKLEGQNE